jgi:hypothetical protein
MSRDLAQSAGVLSTDEKCALGGHTVRHRSVRRLSLPWSGRRDWHGQRPGDYEHVLACRGAHPRVPVSRGRAGDRLPRGSERDRSGLRTATDPRPPTFLLERQHNIRHEDGFQRFLLDRPPIRNLVGQHQEHHADHQRPANARRQGRRHNSRRLPRRHRDQNSGLTSPRSRLLRDQVDQAVRDEDDL